MYPGEPVSTSSVYNMTKFGATAFAEALRQEMLSRRVRVSVVEPGTVDTELITHLREDIGRRPAARRLRSSRCGPTTSPTRWPTS
jgi:NADP-dependent 3-hydroxy acid dehydrogenase YdfG